MLFETSKYPQDYLKDKPYLAGLLTGVVGGVAIGLLFAPRAGKDLRSQISNSIGDRTDEAQHQWEKTKSQAKETIGNIKF